MPPPAEGFAARLVLGPALRAQPDRRLVSLVRDGYEAAFEEIVRRYGTPLTRYAGSIVGSRAEDVTQDAFSKALLALRRDGNEIDLRPWLFRIVRNTALNDLRDNPPSAEALAEEIAGGGAPAEVLERREELADLMRRLRSLPEPQRAAIVMRELEGLSHEEIASALGLTGGGARQAIYRARQALREGVGALLPLPFLRTLIEHGSETAAAGATAGGVGGAAAASGALGGAALKAGVVTAVLAGSVGAGVALHDSGHEQADAASNPIHRGVQRADILAPAPRQARAKAAISPGVADDGAGPHRRDVSSGRRNGDGHGPGNRGTRQPLVPADGGRPPHGPDRHGGRRHAPAEAHDGARGPRGVRGDDGPRSGSGPGRRPPPEEGGGGGEGGRSGPGSPGDEAGHQSPEDGEQGDPLRPPREETRGGDGESSSGDGNAEAEQPPDSGAASGGAEELP